MGGAPYEGAILLGHLHWDHTQGVPFFVGGDQPEAQVRLYIPEQGNETEVFARFMSPPHFPIGPEGLRGDWTLTGLEEGDHRIEEFDVLALDIPHKGGRMLGFRVSDGTSSFAYLSDHSPLAEGEGPDGLGAYHDNARRLADGVDLLIHDAQHTAEELPARAAFGHSAMEYAVGLGRKSGAKAVLLFHHDPNRTDAQMDEALARFEGSDIPVQAAVQGKTIDLPG